MQLANQSKLQKPPTWQIFQQQFKDYCCNRLGDSITKVALIRRSGKLNPNHEHAVDLVGLMKMECFWMLRMARR